VTAVADAACRAGPGHPPARPRARVRGPAGAVLAVAIAVGVGAVLAALWRPAAAAAMPSASDVINRVLAAVPAPGPTTATIQIQFRIGSPVSSTCAFRGRLEVWRDRSALKMDQATRTPVCWAIQHVVLQRLLADRDRADALLPRYQFDVLGEKLVDGRPHYLVYGRALAPDTEPRWMMGWVDYERGLVTEDTLQYGWGRVDTTQEYTQAAGAWLPLRQRIEIPRFNALLDIAYGDIRVAPKR